MDQSRCLVRLGLVAAIANVLLCGTAQALVVEGGASVNTTSSGFNDIFYNVGRVGSSSAVYLGDGWAITASHVTVQLPNAAATFQLPGGTSASYRVINQVGLPGNPDLQLIQLAQAPPLQSIFQNITTSTPQPGSVVAMVGAGYNNGGSLYWNNASASSSGVVNLGTSTTTAATGTPNPIPSDTYWNNVIYHSGATVAQGTYQDAGFAWGGSGEIQWGESVVTLNNITIGSTTTFGTTFYNSVYDPPSSSFWGSQLSTVNSEVAAIGSNMAQVATYDSGGGIFSKSGSGWNLSGIIIDLADVGADRQPPNGTPTNAAYGDLSFAVDLSQYATSIQTVINSTATWTGGTNGTWDNTSANWSNANNGATSFASNGNAKFADTNPQFKIPLNPSSSLPMGTPPLVGMQSVIVQSTGVSANAITFTNTGSANGGVDYVFSDASGSAVGISGTVAMDLSGNGNGVGGSVYLTGANSFTGRVQVFVGQLILQNAFALGSSANDTVYDGAAMELQATSGTATTFGVDASGPSGTVSLALSGSGIGGTGALNSISGINTYAGPIQIGTAATIGSSSTTSGDQLLLTGAINTTGGTLTFTGPGNTTISGGGVAGGGTLIKTGSGTLILNFAGIGSPASNLVSSASALSLGGGTLALSGGSAASTSYSQQFSALTINSGASAVQLNAGSDPLLLSINGAINRNVGGTVSFNLLNGTQSATNGNTTTATNQAGSILGGWATVGLSDWATISGGQIVALSSLATNYTNDTWAAANNTTVTMSSAPPSGSTTNSLRFNQSMPATLNLSGTNVITSGGILVTPAATLVGVVSGGTLEGAAGADLIVIQNSSAGLTIASTIADNGTATGLTKSGSGVLTLLSPNTYSGVTTLNAGTLNINNNTAIGSGTLVINGGTIENASGGLIITNNAETWNGSFTFQGSNALSQSTGAVTLTASPTITIGNSGTLSIGGNIGDTAGSNFGFTLAGSGTLAVSGTNTFTGGVTINGGTLRLGSAGALNSSVVSFTGNGRLDLNGNSISVGGLTSTSSVGTVTNSASPATLTINGAGNYNFAGTIGGGGGSLSLVKSGSGTQILSGVLNYTGTTTINAGVLEFGTAAGGGAPSGMTVNSGGTVAVGSAISQPFLTVSDITAGSTGTVALAANSSNNLNFSGLAVSLGSIGSYTYSGTLTPNGSNYNLGGGGGLLTFSGLLSGANSLTLLNGGDVAPTNANTYTGGTNINAGTTLLASGDTNAVGSNSSAQLGQVPSSATTNITINGGTLQATSTFALNANRGISLGPSGGTIDVDGITSNNSNTLTYNGVITGGGSLTLTDTGTLVLGGVNMYNGGTNISSGTLRAGIANTIPQSSAVTLGLAGTLQLNGFSQSIGSLTGGGVVTDNSSTSVTLTVDNTSPAAYYGVISDTNTGTTGTLALTKVGSGTLTLTGLNTYSGGTTVNGGTLIVDTAPTLAKNSQLVVNSGTLQFNVTSGTATVQSGVTATIAPAATLQLAGTVSALSDGSAINPADGQLVNINNNGSTASGGGLSVSGTNQSVGTITGTVTSSPGAATTYSGDTIVGAGASLTATQILQNTLAIGAGSTVTIRPSGSGIATPAIASDAATSDSESTSATPASGTSLEIQSIQNRIAVLEQLEAADSGSNASPLDETPSALAGSSSGVPNPATADLTSDSEASLLASEIAILQNRENLLLAEENSSTESGNLAAAFSSTDVPAGGIGVPEPSGLLLALFGAAAVAACAVYRFSNRLSALK